MDQTCERNNMQESWKGIHHKLLPAAPAGADRRVPNGIRMGDRIGVQSLEQDGRTNWWVSHVGQLPCWDINVFNNVLLATMSFVMFVYIWTYVLLFLSRVFRSVMSCCIVARAASISSVVSAMFTIAVLTILSYELFMSTNDYVEHVSSDLWCLFCCWLYLSLWAERDKNGSEEYMHVIINIMRTGNPTHKFVCCVIFLN